MNADFAVPFNDRHLVLNRARDALEICKQALRDTRDPRRRLAALRNIVVFGRSVTNIIENLRSRVEGFDDWYKPRSAEMSKDPLCRFFYELRSEILKEGKLEVSNYAHIKSLDGETLRCMPKPRNTVGFFMGDALGGCGWEVETSPGIKEKFYVELPEQIGSAGLTFKRAARAEGQDVEQRDALKLCERYLRHMERIVKEAEERWGAAPKI